ncbi:hypothetical protein [Bradyrhizobium sp. NFR13]|uniref:hypothetical protein n=1 Tax=Bradyrhizobium sp. NFR13 TaxID=1566285 RepID=UPI000B814154|nr:hypothetical protein [Bradyrhizobium sp. NFR13]
MKKLFNLKEWLTVADAARHLSILFGENVAEADVLRLALDGHLTLSVNFINHTRGRCGRVVSFGDARRTSIPLLDGGGSVSALEGVRIGEDQVFERDQEVVAIVGVWDLTMCGAERLDVEHQYQLLTGGPPVELILLDGPIVSREDGTHCQLQSHFSNNEFMDPGSLETPRNHRDNYYPAGGLPADSVLVVRTSALQELESQLSEPDARVEKPLERRERNTLLIIIAALARLAKIDVTKPAKAGTAIENQAALMGAEVSSRTIQNHLKLIPDALDRRNK